jgi:hypothetical protein
VAFFQPGRGVEVLKPIIEGVLKKEFWFQRRVGVSFPAEAGFLI